MDLSYSAKYEDFRQAVAGFVAAEWRPNGSRASAEQIAAFRAKAIERGYLYRGIPKAHGGSEQPPDILKAQIIKEEFERARAPLEEPGNGVNMLVPTLLAHGSDWQKKHFIPKTLAGEYRWAQGYSEPGSGSDLASLRTKAELRGNRWVINGQKIWTSFARQCQFMFALVRTEPNAPKHEGISYLLLELDQPGITIRPLKQVTGGAEFNEVFFENAVTPADWIVGKRGEGWQISRTTLKHERSMIGGIGRYEPMFYKLVDLARRTQRNGQSAIKDPEVRQWLAALEGYMLSHKYSSLRQLSMNAKGNDPGYVSLMSKLVSTNLGHEIARIAQELIAEDGLLLPEERRKHAKIGNERWVNQFFGSLGVAIAGGTSNIQRNIIAERGLGLPRDTFAGREQS